METVNNDNKQQLPAGACVGCFGIHYCDGLRLIKPEEQRPKVVLSSGGYCILDFSPVIVTVDDGSVVCELRLTAD